jgi:hypothetical protein
MIKNDNSKITLDKKSFSAYLGRDDRRLYVRGHT